jgi:hypothetical protein
VLGGAFPVAHGDPECAADRLAEHFEGEHDPLAPLDALAHERSLVTSW